MKIKGTFQWTWLQIVYHWRDLSSDTPKRCLFCILKCFNIPRIFCRHQWWDLLLDADIKNVLACVCVCVCACVRACVRACVCVCVCSPRILLSFSHVLSPPFLGFAPAPWHSEERCLPLSHSWGSHAFAQHITTRQHAYNGLPLLLFSVWKITCSLDTMRDQTPNTSNTSFFWAA